MEYLPFLSLFEISWSAYSLRGYLADINNIISFSNHIIKPFVESCLYFMKKMTTFLGTFWNCNCMLDGLAGMWYIVHVIS